MVGAAGCCDVPGRADAGDAATTAGRSPGALAPAAAAPPAVPPPAFPGAAIGGRAMTGPSGGLLAIAGVWGGATMFAPCRGSGTILRGPGTPAADVGEACRNEGGGGGVAIVCAGDPVADADAAVAAGEAVAAGRGGAATAVTPPAMPPEPWLEPRPEPGAAATTGRMEAGGADLTAASACLRSRIARTASPGFAALERSIFGTTGCCRPRTLCDRLPPLM